MGINPVKTGGAVAIARGRDILCACGRHGKVRLGPWPGEQGDSSGQEAGFRATHKVGEKGNGSERSRFLLCGLYKILMRTILHLGSVAGRASV